MKTDVSLLVTLSIIVSVYGYNVSYRGYKVYEIKPQTYEEADFLHEFEKRFDFWDEGHVLGEPTDILVPPEDQKSFEEELKRHGLDYEIVIQDVESLIEEENRDLRSGRTLTGRGTVTFNNYMLYSEQMAYLRQLAEDYPEATVVTLGQSYENRDILMLKISSGENLTHPKPGIFMDAGIHCREWIAPPIALYTINQLLQNFSNHHMFETVDWYIVPNLNPDGYEYSQTNDRLWRKNRRLTPGAACYGTDLNRNFDYGWMMNGGASNNPCTQTYAGPEPFSEPEARAIRDWILANSDKLKLYISFHSFGEMLMYPWGYDRILPDNVVELQSLGERVVTAIEANSILNSSYVVNTSALTLYIASGTTTDWAKGSAGVELSYIFELPAADSPYFFMLPARQILPVVRETWAGLVVFYEYMVEKFVTAQVEEETGGSTEQPQLDFILRGRRLN